MKDARKVQRGKPCNSMCYVHNFVFCFPPSIKTKSAPDPRARRESFIPSTLYLQGISLLLSRACGLVKGGF